jgi:uncharacterized protein
MLRKSAMTALLLVLAGCSFFSRTKNTIYSLDRIPPAGGAAAAAGRGAPAGVDNLELPPSVDRREIVVRQADQKLEIRANELWSASLHDLVLHTLTFDLADRLPSGAIVLPGQARPANLRPVNVAFEQFDAGPSNNLTLDARWTIGGTAHHEQITVPLASLKSAEIARGTSEAIAQLADRIAAGL